MKCAICNSPQIYPYKEIERVAIFQCKKCLLAFVNPTTSRKNTNHIYSFADYQKREEQFRKRYSDTVSLLKKYNTGNKILEVGSGFGLLSSILADNGYEVDALEPDVSPYYLQDTTVRIIKKNFLSFAKKTVKKYDAIILYDVLEHVDNLKETVSLFEKLLKKNGIVFVQTPNYLSCMAALTKNWSWWMVEDHRFFFSKKSFKYLFSQRTWKGLHFTTYEDWIDFKKNLDGNFQNRIDKALFFGWFIPLYFVIRKLIWRFGYGGLHLAIWQYNKR